MAFSKQKARILLGLELGTKLHELMREPDMPSKRMLEEWRDNDPEFEAAYLAAEAAGRVKRGEPAPAPRQPAPVVISQDGEEHEIPRSTALRNDAPAAPAPNRRAEALKTARAAKAAKRTGGEQPGPRATTTAHDVVQHLANLEQQNAHLTKETHRWSAAEKETKQRHQQEVDTLKQQLATQAEIITGYQEWGQDVKRLTRELDVALFGENAAPQASLCDLISPARALAESFRKLAQKALTPDAEPTPVLELHAPAPSGPEHPGTILLALLRKAGTRRAQLAEALGIKSATLKELLAGNSSMSLELCGKLEKLCIGTAEVWARRQVDYNNHRQQLVLAA